MPPHSNDAKDLTTTAPSSRNGIYASSSIPRPQVPEAVMTGFFNDTDPTCVAICGDRDRNLTAGDTPATISLQVDAPAAQTDLALPPTPH